MSLAPRHLARLACLLGLAVAASLWAGPDRARGADGFQIYLVPDAVPVSESQLGIAAGPDGNIWFTEGWLRRIGRITPAGEITQFPLPFASGSRAEGIAAGPDGRMWFTVTRMAKETQPIAAIDTAGQVTEMYSSPAPNAFTGIAAGPDGVMWVSTRGPDGVLRLGVDGGATAFPLPTPRNVGGPAALTVDTGGSIWFTGYDTSLMRMAPDGQVTEYASAYRPACKGRGPCGSPVRPRAITTGPEGDVWFVAGGGPTGTAIGRIDPAAPPPVPSLLAGPSLRGQGLIGGRLTARPGRWANDPDEYAFRWQVCDRKGRECRSRKGRASGVVLGPDDVGRRLRAMITATNEHGSAFATTALTDVVGGAPPPLRIAIDSRREHVGRDGRVRIHISCGGGPRGGICSGRVLIGLTNRRRGGIGVARYRLATGDSKGVAVRLAPRARGLVSRRRGRRVLVTVTLWGAHPASRKVRIGP